MENRDLTTLEGRQGAISDLGKDLIKSLRDIGIELHDDAVAVVGESTIELNVFNKDTGKMYFASDVTLHRGDLLDVIHIHISYGTNESFDPSNIAPYWRTVTAASLLKRWDVICILVDSYFEVREALNFKIKEVNNVKSSFEK